MLDLSMQESRNISLVELLDRVLDKGAVISGEVAISVADIELIKLGLQLVIASTGTLVRVEASARASETGPGKEGA